MKLRRKSTRRRVLRYSLVGGNAMLLVAVLAFVMVSQHSSGASDSITPGSANAASTAATNPLDQLSSADIAVNVARLSALPEATAVVNQADSVNTELTISPASTSIVAKQQVVNTALKSKKDIQAYVVVAGDTVTSIATKFGVTSDSIRWSNGLSGNAVNAGTKLTIPPLNGIVYTVNAGDTPDNLAAKFKTTRDMIIAYNDAEITGIQAGEQIIIPNGTQAAPVVSFASTFSSSSFAWGSAPIYGYNGYDYGFCTYYVATKISVPANWGNANTWDNRAGMSGWTVSSIPRAGAIAQTDRGSEGHVGLVQAVSEDGTQIKYSDMNGIAGWGRVGYSDWTSSSRFEHYIYQ